MSRGWRTFLIFAFLAGAVLRLAWVQDMEYKEDEEYNFTQTQVADPWPGIGMPSGVYIPNPGMSVWAFTALAKVSRAETPTELARSVQLFSLLGILLIIPFAIGFLKRQEREPWFWACALALVNPFAIVYQRKLWPEPFLPFFCMLMLMGWWRREVWLGALAWGLFGAWLGQIHMSGFFVAGGLFAWTLFGHRAFPKKRPHWLAWLGGSLLGAATLVPWLIHLLKNPTREHFVLGMSEIVQLKYWVFWITDAFGLTVGNPIGLLHGNSILRQISDFVRYPLLGDRPTYLVGVFHIVILGAGLGAMTSASRGLWRARARLRPILLGTTSETAFAQNAALWAGGALMTATGVMIRRYYMAATFPFEFVWLARAAKLDPRRARLWLSLIWLGQLGISAGFVWYVHVNDGSVHGDYGKAYHVIMDERNAAKTSSSSSRPSTNSAETPGARARSETTSATPNSGH